MVSVALLYSALCSWSHWLIMPCSRIIEASPQNDNCHLGTVYSKLVRMIPFTHKIFVDFSGDDGAPSKPNASKVISMAWVLSSVEDIHHNEGVVLQIKKLIGCRPKDEIKWRSIRRHRRLGEILKILEKVKVNLLILIVLKQKLTEERLIDTRTKKLVNIIHWVPINRFFITGLLLPYPQSWFQLVFDEVGWAGCEEEIRDFYRKDKDILWDADTDPDSLMFGKSGAILLLQLADIFAGILREYVEQQIEKGDFPPCHICNMKQIRDCTYKRKGLTVGKADFMKTPSPLLIANKDGKRIDFGFMVRPPEEQYRYLFVDCLFKRR